MPNTSLTSIMAKILARALASLREKCMMPQLVNSNYQVFAAQKGSTIDVPIPSAQTAAAVTPSNTPPAPASQNLKTVQVILNQWQKTEFFLTDKEMGEIDRQAAFLPMQAMEAVRALANAVNADLLGQYTSVFGYTGTAGTTPFTASDSDAVNARKILGKQLCPLSDRRAVLDYNAEANALSLQSFKSYLEVGSTAVKIEGTLGRKYGIDWYVDDQIPTHPGGTQTGTVTVNGAQAIGVGSTDNNNFNGTVALSTAAASSLNYIVGDIITFAGDSNTYVVTAATGAIGASANVTVSIAPALKIAKVGGEAVTLKAAHVVNLVFHRDAYAFANRPLEQTLADLSLGNQMLSMQDPVSGLIMRLEVSRQYKQTVWEFDILWGSKIVRPQLATRLAG